jgi:hypothetical protein
MLLLLLLLLLLEVVLCMCPALPDESCPADDADGLSWSAAATGPVQCTEGSSSGVNALNIP